MLQFIGGAEDSYYLVTELFKLKGHLDVAALRSAVKLLIERHDMTRARFSQDASEYLVVPYSPADAEGMFSEVGLLESSDAAVTLATERLRKPLRLADEPPLRMLLARTGDEEWLFAAAGHHLVFDGWSFKLVWDELAEAYGAFSGGRTPDLRSAPQYWAPPAAARRHREVPDWQAELRRTYREIRSLHARAASPLGPAGHASLLADDDLDERLAVRARERRTTPYAIGAAAMLRALSAALGDTQVILGTAFAGRLTGAAVKTLGYYSTSIFVGTDLNVHATDDQLLAHIGGIIAQWQSSPRAQWEPLLAQHDAHDLYPVKFSFQPVAMIQPDMRLDRMTVERITAAPGTRARRPLDLQASYGDGSIRVSATYRTDAMTHDMANEIAHCFLQQLRSLCK